MLTKIVAATQSQTSFKSSIMTRFFSRSDILKSLDRAKVRPPKTFIKKELTENPEFFKAFPHMQAIFNVKEEEKRLSGKGGSSGKEDDVLTENPKYYHD